MQGKWGEEEERLAESGLVVLSTEELCVDQQLVLYNLSMKMAHHGLRGERSAADVGESGCGEVDEEEDADEGRGNMRSCRQHGQRAGAEGRPAEAEHSGSLTGRGG